MVVVVRVHNYDPYEAGVNTSAPEYGRDGQSTAPSVPVIRLDSYQILDVEVFRESPSRCLLVHSCLAGWKAAYATLNGHAVCIDANTTLHIRQTTGSDGWFRWL